MQFPIVRRIRDLYRDPEYFLEVRRLALPIIAQQLMFSLLNMVGVVFVGHVDLLDADPVDVAGEPVLFVRPGAHLGAHDGVAAAVRVSSA